MGTVHRVEHVHMHKRFALKVLDRAWVGSAEMLALDDPQHIAAARAVPSLAWTASRASGRSPGPHISA